MTRVGAPVDLADRHRVDYWGNEHEIELMPADYVRNVIGFCRKRTERIFLVATCELLYRLALVLAGVGAPPSRELAEACFLRDLDLAGEEPQLRSPNSMKGPASE